MKRSLFSLIRLGLLGVACVSLGSQLLSGKAPQHQPVATKRPTLKPAYHPAIIVAPCKAQIAYGTNHRIAFVATLPTKHTN